MKRLWIAWVLLLVSAPLARAQCPYWWADLLDPGSTSEGYKKWRNGSCIQITFNGTTGFGAGAGDAVQCGFETWNGASNNYYFYVYGGCSTSPELQGIGNVEFVTTLEGGALATRRWRQPKL